MSRFKQLWSSFWRKDQGLGMIEMALLLPIFLIFAFAVIDFGNYLIVKNRIVSANQAIASAIQNNPTMTTGEWGSSSDLEKVIQNSLGDLWFKNGAYIGYTGVTVWASRTPPSLATAPGGQDGWLIRDIKNPWLSDADPSNDNNPYYVGVRVWRGVPFLTPLPKLLGFADGVTPGFHDDDTSREWGASNGRKGADSFTFVTLGGTSCPAGKAFLGIGTPGADSTGCASLVIGPFNISDVTTTEIAHNCIDAVNPSLEDNQPTKDPWAFARFLNTCGNRYCITGPKLQDQGFTFGRVTEFSGELAILQCFKSSAQ